MELRKPYFAFGIGIFLSLNITTLYSTLLLKVLPSLKALMMRMLIIMYSKRVNYLTGTMKSFSIKTSSSSTTARLHSLGL